MTKRRIDLKFEVILPIFLNLFPFILQSHRIVSMKILRVIFAAFFLLLLCKLRNAECQEAYHTYDEMTKTISQLTDTHKDIAKVESIGKTLLKRDIWAVTIGGKDADNHQAVLIVGGAEANRLIGSELTLKYLEFLLTHYGEVDSVTQLIRSTTFYFIPRVNPDASEAFFQSPRYERTFNARPIDDDKDGSIDEDGYEDLNGDGFITMMRVKDDSGEWIVHPGDLRIMKKGDPSKGERGTYKLFSEGIDNDKDDQWNEDEPGGVDFNKNFPHNYIFFSRGAGPHQISEAETRAVADFAFAHQNIAVVFTFSSNDNLMNPWKKVPGKGSLSEASRQPRSRRFSMEDDESQSRFITSVMDEDEEYFSYISKQYQDITKLKNAPPSSKGEGSFSEWAYFHYGRWSFAANPWWIPEVESKKDTAIADTSRRTRNDTKKPEQIKGKGGEEKPDEYSDQMKTLKWLDANGMKDGFIQWTKVKHPDFLDKEVEVGGFKPYITINPPAESSEALASKHNAFLTMLAAKLPRIAIRNIKVEPLDNKVYRLTADIVNTGYLPTNSAMGAKADWPRNVKVSLILSNNQVLASGKSIAVLEPIKGSGGRKELTWLIVSQAGAQVTLSAESPLAGKLIETVTLK
jgi:hypothetical protein